MSKVSGSYPSVILGVSEQVPDVRRPGQHFEQVNFISDPVRRLCRRRGSVHEHEKTFADFNAAYKTATVNDTAYFRSFDFVVGDDRYTMTYRTKAKPANSQAPFAFCFNRETRQFIPVVVSSDALMNSIVQNGASAITNIQRYIYIAGNGIVPTYSTSDVHGNTVNSGYGVIWVRSGAYKRKFSAKIRLKKVSDNSIITLEGEYETVPAVYPGVLDTSDIVLIGNDNYQKEINDRTNEYNTALNQWIETSAADVVATNIATKIKESLETDRTAEGLTAADVAIEISNANIGINCSNDYVIEELTVSDNGDGTLIRGVGNVVEKPDDLTAEHYVGKVVKVLAKKADDTDAIYYKAEARHSGVSTGDLAEVTWKETAGVITQPLDVFAFATVEAGTLYIAGSAAELQTMTGITQVPGFEPSRVGDENNVKVPYFLGRKIDYLGLFQDRLVIGSGATLLFSRPGIYLDFFRQTVLSVVDDDPIEVFTLGSEDDTIISSTTYDKSLVLFGKRKQYILNGRNVLTPKTIAIVPLSSHEDAMNTWPVASGNFVFYTKYRNQSASLHQIQAGVVQDNPESYEVSGQLSTYINGRPVELLPITTPNTVIMRTADNRHSLFIYTYYDRADGQERIFDSWSRWDWNSQLGYVSGMSFEEGDISVFTIRHGVNSEGNEKWWIASDRFSQETHLGDKPHLDSLRTYDSVVNPTPETFIHSDCGLTDMSAAFDGTVRERFLGQSFETMDNLVEGYPTKLGALWVGMNSPALCTPTNPYVRDKDDNAIINGRLTIVKFIISVADAGGFTATLQTAGRGEYPAVDWTGRTVSRLTAELGVQPIVATSVSLAVGRETREFKYNLKSRDWFPLSITNIEWTGLFYYNSRRV